ncbi:MAG: four helix bundle protein [Candidatus Omnitrophica bacterium]|nr:four helix bundle protein [Candidatus Omnitrophota bacterium]
MQSYRDLEIYRTAHRLAVEIHKLTLELPKFEIYEEGSQIRRSSKAISANIVEGFGRKKHKQDYVRFLIYAHSSCDETMEHLDYLFETKSLKNLKLYKQLMDNLVTLSKKINRFIQVVSS